MDIFNVKLTKRAEHQLKRLPIHIVFKLQTWIDGVQFHGLREMRKTPGFHDEALQGKRQGQRSIRLNKAYRAIYILDVRGAVHFLEILEVNKHDY